MNERINSYFDLMSSEEITGWLNITKRRKKTVKALFEYFAENNFCFTRAQIKEIYRGLIYSLSKEKIMIYADDKFDDKQMYQICIGLERGYSVRTVKAYAKSELSEKHMECILDALKKGAKIQKLEPYIDSKYNYKQLEVIVKAIISEEPRMDLIANPKYSAAYMDAIRENLIEYRKENVEYYVERYSKKDFSPKQLYHILYYACDSLNEFTNRQIDFIANPKFNEKQMEEIADGFKYGLDFEKVKLYAKPEFDYAQMDRIMDSLRFDRLSPKQIKPYINVKFDYKQLEYIFYGLRIGYDVSIYAKEYFDYEQMGVIMCALRDKVSKKKIDTILNPKLTADSMKIILDVFKRGATVDEVKRICNDDYNENTLKELFQKYVLIVRNKELKKIQELLS